MFFVIGLWTFLRGLFFEPAAVALENLALRAAMRMKPEQASKGTL
jgi:hypothetical protein